ncbi:hypothetical protein Bca52824_056437 [Brassica carinata]|uniref:Uncharacterized protein n=1 Tax=Brassica carinata TaxID=52824 RepID=A0A8X7QQF9_BRACI|nr:hypothetical protein Bca52824_056437 [Brassica carinata]
MAKCDVAIASSSHAEDESPRPHLADERSEATPPRNELLTTIRSRGHGGTRASSPLREGCNKATAKSPSAPLDATSSESLKSENPNQRLAKAKGKAKNGGEGKLSSRSARVSHPLPSSSSAPTPSTTTGPRRFSVHDLGSVSIPQGVLTQDDLHTVLQQTTRALQALTGIVQDLSRSVAGFLIQEGTETTLLQVNKTGVSDTTLIDFQELHQDRLNLLLALAKEYDVNREQV